MHAKSSRRRSQFRAARFVSAAIAGIAVADISLGQTVTHWKDPVHGTWSQAANWTNQAPGDGYDAIIDAVGSPYTVRLLTNASVGTLTLASPNAWLDHLYGTLHADVLRLAAGTYSIAWGTIADTTIRRLPGDTGTLVLASSPAALDHVRLEADIGLPSDGGQLDIYRGLELANHNVNITAGNRIYLRDSTGFVGSGDVVVNARPASTGYQTTIFGFSSTLNIGSGITIRTGTSGGSGGIVLGDYDGAHGRNTVNAGTISSQTATYPIWVNGASFVNEGTVEARNGGVIQLNVLENRGAIRANSSSTVNFSGVWSNAGGTMIADGGVLSLGGTFSPQNLGQYETITGGLMEIAGTYNNSASTLSIGESNADWRVRLGRVVGGSIVSINNAALPVIDGGTFDGVNLAVPINFSGGTSQLTGKWSNQDVITLNAATLNLSGTWTDAGVIRGTGTLIPSGKWTMPKLANTDLSGITLNVGGSLHNDDYTLDIDSAAAVVLSAGTISNGTIIASKGSRLRVRKGVTHGSLQSVSLGADVQVDSNAVLDIWNGVTLLGGAKILVGTGTNNPTDVSVVLAFNQGQTIGGVGEIVLNGPQATCDVRIWGPLTVEPGITLRTGSTGGTLEGVTGTLINNGAILSETNGRRIDLAVRLNNQGIVSATNGGTIVLPNAADLLNFSAGTLTGGTWSVGDNSTMNFGSSITTNNANITLDGASSSFAAINPLESNLGLFSITNGRNFSSVGSLTNSGTINIGSLSTLTVLDRIDNAAGLIDLNCKMVVDYSAISPLSELVGQIGTHIISSAANADPSLGIGSKDDGNVVLLQLAKLGDANLDGAVNYTDLVALSQNYSTSSLVGPGWVGGDFNYDGSVNLTDLYALGYQYNDPLNPLPQALQTLGLPVIEVPEPGMMLLFAGMLGGTLRPRKRTWI